MGALAPLVHGMGARRTFLECLTASVLSQIALLFGMIVFAIEGIVCILMAAPLWLCFAAIGTSIAFPLHVQLWRPYVNLRGFPLAGLLLLLLTPGWMGAEHLALSNSPVPLFTLSTTIDIDAPPDVVWQRVLAFPAMPAPGWRDRGWLFKVGIARPLRAEFDPQHATRYCVFSTGKATEPVTTWIPNRFLEVDVTDTPPSMEETSIYPHLHPAHLEGYLTSARARFELIPLPGNRTRVVGTSWYRNRMYPERYWRFWSDQAIKAVQVHVLRHIKSLAEADFQLRQ
jgi:hypothetical protein